MNEKRTSLEIIAPSVEEAIQQGLQELGVPSANVQIDILDEGRRGLFGIGARQARVRLTIKESPQPVTTPSVTAEKIIEKETVIEKTPPPAEQDTQLLSKA